MENKEFENKIEYLESERKKTLGKISCFGR